MKNKIDLINDCFSMLLRTGVTVNASPDDNVLALNRLEDMMAELESRNLATGYNFEDSPEPDSPSGLENWMNLAISQMLAMRVWPDFSPDEVNPMLARNSAQSSANLSARLAQQNALKYARRTPLGSGNQPYQQYNKFFGDYGSTCGPSDVSSGGCAPVPTPPPLQCSCDVIPLSHLKLLGDEALFGASEKQYSITGFYGGSTVGGGLFVFNPDGNKATHNGVTVYAPEALQAWAGTQADIATLLNWAGVGSGVLVRVYDFIDPSMAGAVGSSDDTAAVTKAISVASSLLTPLKGTRLTYGVSGNITLPSWVWIDGLKLKQLAPNSTSRRTLFQSSGQFCRLENVIVNRNGDGSGGSLASAAGVWISDCPSVVLNNVEVFGNDYGSGIVVFNCDNAEINSPYVHDITGGTASSSAVTDDTIQGVWVQRGTGVRVTNPRVKNLLNRWSGQSAFNRFSRGISVGGAKRFSISSPMVDNVDQGIDLTGDENPEYFEVSGGIVSNCYTWGTKCANSVQNGVFTGVVAYRCGNAGFVASAPSVVMPDITQNITYTGCKSIQTGFGGAWTALSNVAGFRVSNTAQYPDYPRSIKYIGCSADGTGGVMEYGFFSDVTLGTTDGEQWIETIHCDVHGATIKNYFGINTGFALKNLGSTTTIPNDVWTDVTYTTVTDFMKASVSSSAAELVATRSGIYQLEAGVTWEPSSAGTRFIRILVNGVEVKGSVVRLAAVTGNEFNINTSATVPISIGGAAIKVQIGHDRGSPLNITNATFRISLISAGFGG